MKEDLMIKSVLLGGFDKKEVLALIERIQSEHFDESENIKKKDEEIEAVKAKVAQYEDRLESERRRFSALAALNDEYCERIYNLEEQIKEQHLKFENIQDDCDRLKKVEVQIGALLVDAVLYSDKMTEKAKNAATSITSDAKHALVSTAEDVGKLSAEIAQISGDFKSDISALVEKVEILSNSLSVFSARLETDFDASREEPYDGQEVFDHFISQYKKTVCDHPGNEIDDPPQYDQTENDADDYPDKIMDGTQIADDSGTADILPESGSSVIVEVDGRQDCPVSETIQADLPVLADDISEPIESPAVVEGESTPVDPEIGLIEENKPEIMISGSDDTNMDELTQNITETNEIIAATQAIDELNYAQEPDDKDLTEETVMALKPDSIVVPDPARADENGSMDLLKSDTDSQIMQESVEIEVKATGIELSDNSDETISSADEETANEPTAMPEEIEVELQPKKYTEPEPVREPVPGTGFEIEEFPLSEDVTEQETQTENSDTESATGITGPGKARDISESDVDELLKLFSE